jgi:cell wall-associated NlpC family hydrolase
VSPTPKPSPKATRKHSQKDDSSAAPTATPDSTASEPKEAAKGSSLKNEPVTSVASLNPEQLRDFDAQPLKVQELIRNSLALTERNLGYKYGSADPAQGGMDCSGFIYYVLSSAGFREVPRQSSDQYLWVRKNSDFHSVLSRNPETFELKEMQPGDLMFWSGTYAVNRDVPISHVMIYLGLEKSAGKPVMVGASDGRTYDGKQRFGVSVFDFRLPNGQPNKNDPDLVARFEGYAPIPGLRDPVVTSSKPLKEHIPKGRTAPQTSPEPLTDGD